MCSCCVVSFLRFVGLRVLMFSFCLVSSFKVLSESYSSSFFKLFFFIPYIISVYPSLCSPLLHYTVSGCCFSVCLYVFFYQFSLFLDLVGSKFVSYFSLSSFIPSFLLVFHGLQIVIRWWLQFSFIPVFSGLQVSHTMSEAGRTTLVAGGCVGALGLRRLFQRGSSPLSSPLQAPGGSKGMRCAENSIAGECGDLVEREKGRSVEDCCI